jgi:polyvinyl alcohol dehydrogenase (cytochrome)
MRHRVALLVVAVLCGSLMATGARAGASCAGPATGGDWPSYGHDLSNTRMQDQEDAITAATAGGLQKAFAFSTASTGQSVGFQSTPVVAGGCVYAGSSAGGGWVFAINADSGELVWATQLQEILGEPVAGLYALSVADGRVHAQAAVGEGRQQLPRAIALDAADGHFLWASEGIDNGYQADVVASPVVFDGMQLVAATGPDSDANARAGFGLVDAATGTLLKKNTVTPSSYFADGFAGAGMWATPVVDPESGYAFNGTAQPYSKKVESEYDNAIVKIDVSPNRDTFGSVVDAYKGNVDQYFPGLDRQPACTAAGDQITYIAGFSVPCVQLDVDFGGSPTMFRNRRGQLLVGEMQKSGVFHAVFADRMQQAWTAILSYPGAAGNANSAANDGHSIFVVGNPGLLYSLDATTGTINWVMPIADGAEYHPPTVAGGVVYLIGNHGLLVGYDAATGVPVVARSLGLDAGDACASLGGGVAVARHTVYASCDTGAQGGAWIVAYSL